MSVLTLHQYESVPSFHFDFDFDFCFSFDLSFDFHRLRCFSFYRHRVPLYFERAFPITLVYVLFIQSCAIAYDKLLRSLRGYLLAHVKFYCFHFISFFNSHSLLIVSSCFIGYPFVHDVAL